MELLERYQLWLKPGIVDVRIVQIVERVWLEITEEETIGGYLTNQTIRRTDLGFCARASSSDQTFSPADPVAVNARKFVQEWDPYSIIMTTDLFHREACERIHGDPDYNPYLKSR